MDGSARISHRSDQSIAAEHVHQCPHGVTDGGFEVLGNDGFDTPQAAAQAALNSGAPVVVICGTDDMYPDVVAPITQAVKAANSDITVILAGYPKDQIEAHKAAGVDEFIHVRANVIEILGGLQAKLGGE